MIFNNINNRLKDQLALTRYNRDFLFKAINTSQHDLNKRFSALVYQPNPKNLILFLRSITNSSTWVGTSFFQILKSLNNPNINEYEKIISTDNHKYIIDCINRGIKINYKMASYSEIFKSIYSELKYAHKFSQYESKLSIPKIDCTIVLVSGVFNEIFSTAAFERGAKHLNEKYKIKYFAPRVNGTKSSKYNSKSIKKQLNEYIEAHPNEKLWLLAFSKGGIDSLHYLVRDVEFANKYILGLSTIASPILGSDHLNHRALKIINKIHSLSNFKIYKNLDEKMDIMLKEFQKSLSSHFQKNWFKDNFKKLPNVPFYTSLALESEWHESHIWMILAKFFFPSDSINDGVVDAENAMYPSYFKGINLGIIKGHHLISTRSSSYNQEALLEAHIIFLKHLKLI